MAKYENIRALAKKQLQAVTESSDRWKAFLRTVAIAYNYSFPNQLLIHEQSPTATAVADIAYWNNNAGRWVKRGAHGIAVFDTRANSSRLRYRGTDIPAPEGTPILAAHSGTVLVSGWNDSYGNQVLLDNGAGLSTRYAHMTQTAVTAGEAVTAGQVIGYVGSTGDSTGNHLHFEVMQNGVRVNPLDAVTPQ